METRTKTKKFNIALAADDIDDIMWAIENHIENVEPTCDYAAPARSALQNLERLHGLLLDTVTGNTTPR